MKIVSPPDGVFYSGNITPDPSTGIGSWSFDEITGAIAHGVGRDGNGLRVMPYQYFAHATNEDMNALVAYLRSIPPVRHEIPQNEPLTFGSLIAVGLRAILPFLDKPSQDFYYGDFGGAALDPGSADSGLRVDVRVEQALVVAPLASTPEIERGRYLVTISACALCHSPIDVLGRPVAELALAGGLEIVDPRCGSVFSRNLTPDRATGLGDWTDDQIARAIRAGVSRDGDLLCTAVMPSQAYASFSDHDIQAIVAYLRAIPTKVHAIPPSQPPTGEELPAQQFFAGDAGTTLR
jgi:hypothetical protein